MRYALLLLSVVLGVSCSDFTRPKSSPEYLRCPIPNSASNTEDVPISSTDSSLFGSLTKKNDFNCVSNPTICASLGANFSCNHLKGCCDEAWLGRCSKSTDCLNNDKPVCIVASGICTACSAADPLTGDQQCGDWNKVQMDPLNRHLCIGGLCAECRSNSDCTRPGKTFCDMTDNICKGCTNHNQCPGSNLCKLDASLLAMGDGLTNIGECVKTTDVVFVDNNPANCDAAGASGKPFCQVTQAVASGKSYIVVKGNGGTAANLYSPVTVDNGKQVAIIGPGRDAAPFASKQAVINGVTISTSARVTLIGLSVTASGTPAVQCTGSGSLYLQNVLISDAVNTPKGGVYANGCSKVDIQRTKITGAAGYGVFISGGSGHRVINNAIINGGVAAEPAGMRISSGADGLFAFNTIANNRQGGVMCDTAVVITDSILMLNGSDPQLSAGCQQMRIVTTGVVLEATYQSGGDPKVMSDPTNQCGDKGEFDSSMTIKDDYFAVKRPLGNKPDIGFHEFK